MKTLFALIKRNTKLFFNDKGMFFTSLITPLILLVLYTTFLGNVYKNSLAENFPGGMSIPEKLMNGLVGGQLASSILAVSCVTVAFCSNFLMVQDKVTGSINDLLVSPVKKSTLSLGYYISSFISTLLICLAAALMLFIYLAVSGWYLSTADILFIILDVLLLVLFGTALSSVINYFLSTQGQISAVGTIVSAGYGFICGAYMPISSFPNGLQKALSFMPGTYGTALLRNHFMRGALSELEECGVPQSVVMSIKDALDCNIYFFSNKVSIPVMYLILASAVAVLIGIYVLLNACKKRKA